MASALPSLSHSPERAGPPDPSPRSAAKSQGEPRLLQASDPHATSGGWAGSLEPQLTHPLPAHKYTSVHPPSHPLMTHEVSLQESASQGQTRSLKWIGSQES